MALFAVCCGYVVQHLSLHLTAPAGMLREHAPVLAAQIYESLANRWSRYGRSMVSGAICNFCKISIARRPLMNGVARLS